MASGPGCARAPLRGAGGLAVRPSVSPGAAGGGRAAPRLGGDPMRWLGLGVAAAAAFVLAVVVGPAHVPLANLMTSDIVRSLRLPRAILAFLVGGALALSGASLQALVRNPLADPFLLGLSGGAGLGAVLAIALRIGGPWALPLAAFAGALVAMGLVYRLGLVGGSALEPLKRRVYLAASLLTAAAVAVSGVIGFVGLVVPHAMRGLWGHQHRPLLPAAFLGGGTLLALSDTVARTFVAPRELPVGIVTALVGVPVFALLLR